LKCSRSNKKRFKVKRTIFIAIIIILVGAAVYLVYPRESEQSGLANPLERTEKVKRGDLVVTISAVGTIEPMHAVEVKSKASGQIMDIRVDEGDRVKTGDLICVLDKTTALNDYRQAEADLSVADVTLQQAEKGLKRQKELFDNKLISEEDYDNALLQRELAYSQKVSGEAKLAQAKESLDDTVIKSPIAGIVLKRYVNAGQIIASGISNVSGGTPIVQVAVMDTVYVEVDVDETDIGKAAVGQKCTVEADAFPDEKFTGKVIKISPLGEVDQNITYFTVTTAVDNSEGKLKAGMNATCEITAAAAYGVLLVPRDAVTDMQSGNQTERRPGGSGRSGAEPGKGVYVVGSEGPKLVPVETGISNYEYTEIKSGLKEGDEIIVRAKSMVMAQREEFRERMKRRNSLPGVEKQQGD
jgi:HlyD family secretion protein